MTKRDHLPTDESGAGDRLPARRGFLHASIRSGLGVFLAGGIVPTAASLSGGGEEWLRGLGTKHRQIFDLGRVGENLLARVRSFLDVYNDSYSVRDRDLGVVVGAHGEGIGFVLGDAMWSRYELGKRFGVTDPRTGQPAVRNPFVSDADRRAPDDAVVSDLQERGVRFLGCRNSLRRLARRLAASDNAAAIRDELEANLLPNVAVVPAMIVAVNRAQESGFSYVSLG